MESRTTAHVMKQNWSIIEHIVNPTGRIFQSFFNPEVVQKLEHEPWKGAFLFLVFSSKIERIVGLLKTEGWLFKQSLASSC